MKEQTLQRILIIDYLAKPFERAELEARLWM